MRIEVIFQTSRKAVIEIKDYGIYYTSSKYEIWLNDTLYGEDNKVIRTIEKLLPDQEYVVEIRGRDGAVGKIVLRTEKEFVTLNVRAFGAKGDGIHDDTLAIQAAICACPKAGRVFVPAGVYPVTTLFLKSDLVLDIGQGAVLLGHSRRDEIPVLPGMIQSYDENSEYNLGSWEGNPLDTFASMITGIGVSNVVITGAGLLDGNATFADWWEDDRAKVIAYRPRMVFLNHCENIVLHGLTIQNSPAWNLHPYFSRHLRFLDLTILNPWDSPNTDGMDPESCEDLEIAGVYFSLGDDCIAIKSGKYYMGSRYQVPSSDIRIRQCCMNNGHGAVTIGSEMAAGVKNVSVRDCLFRNTDRGLRVKTRRGRGKDAVVADIVFENIDMDHVLTPFVVNSFYNCCDPDRHSDYVKAKHPLPVDDRTPAVRQLLFQNIRCTNCHVAGAFLYGLPENKIDYVEMKNICISYADEAKTDEPAMMDDIAAVSKMGLFFCNIKKLVLKNVVVSGSEGEAFLLENIDEIVQEGCGNADENSCDGSDSCERR